MSLKKILIGTGIGGAIIAGVTYVFRLKRTSAELETYAKLNVFKLNLTSMILQVDVQLKNPTATKFQIKFPFVKLSYKGAAVGSSQVINKDIPIPGYGEAVAEKIMIPIQLREEVSVGAELIASFLAGKEVKFSVTKITTIDLGWKKIPYETTEEIILKK